jgi:hypothetical protein
MNTYLGVVSTRPANAPLTAIDGQPTLFDFVTQQASLPQFWGRYIAGKAQGDLLTVDEANFLSSRGCRILLIPYGIQPCGNYQQGQADASSAIAAAQALQIPPGVTLYGDIETRVFAHPDWLLGWWDTMMASLYANPGGLYCNTSPENALYFNNPYCAAVTSQSNQGSGGTLPFNPPLFTSYPRPGCAFDRSSYDATSPDCVPNSAVIWQYAEQCPPSYDLYDMDLANDAGYATMWSGPVTP